MLNFLKTEWDHLKIRPHLLAAYISLYIPVGFFMNQFGIWTGIAKFSHWWQVFTCYGFYMIPISVAVRKLRFHEQYLWGLFAMCLLEFTGYAVGSSQALGIIEIGNTTIVKGNYLAEIVNIKNFSLSMAIFFGLYIPFGNAGAAWLEKNVLARFLSTPSLNTKEL